MPKKLMSILVFILIVCPDGLSYFLVLSIGEIGYRALVYWGKANTGLEFLFLGFGAGFYAVLFSYRISISLIKNNHRNKS